MNTNKLFSPANSPESVGIPSKAVLEFLEGIDRDRTCMHGFLLVRHGLIAAEGYWAPYHKDSMHRMYSVSKSFVSLAIGLMIDEGKLSLNDPVSKFLPDKCPENLHPYTAQATVRDLLMMATQNPRNSYGRGDKDWAATFFHMNPTHPSGTIFSYDTAATVVLNTIVERISGMPFLEYMRPKLLDPIGFTKEAWCIKTPEGTSWGGSGVLCKLRDMAKLAYVCLNKGKWGDKQLISKEYIEAATSKQIDNSNIAIETREGYGYQIWREKNNGFSFRGMGSQLAYCFPDKDFIFACISDTQGAGPTGFGIQKHFERLFEKISDEPLPEDPESLAKLNEKIKSLHILPEYGALHSSYVDKINGVWYELNENPMNITRTRLIFEGDEGVWEYENASGFKSLRFGIGKKVAGHFPQTNYYMEQIGKESGIPYKCLASAAWVEEHKLNMLVYITDIYLGTLKITFSFKNNDIAIYMRKVAEWFLDEYHGIASGTVQS
ncbi:MAG: serine hydrolase domain-containing protein [Clostridia bacterium]|jgi:CubicO group peptidase (beta-lactamase class C family)